MKVKFLTVLLAALMMAGCAGDAPTPTGTPTATPTATPTKTAEAVDTSWEDIKAKGKFIMGMDDTFAPMGFRDESGELVGIDVDVALIAAEKLGVEVEFKPIDWASKEMELDSGKIDCIWNGFTVTEERKKNVLFTDSYLTNHQVIVTVTDSEIESEEQLEGKTVGLQKGSSSLEALEASSVADLVEDVREYEDNVQVLSDLAAGRLDAAVMDEVVAKYYIREKQADYKIGDSLGQEEYAVGVRLKDKAFADEINEVLREMKQNGELDEIISIWYKE